MARNVVFSGGDDDVINFTAGGSAIAAGAVVPMNGTVGIALVAIPAGGTGSVAVGGVFRVPKVGGAAWTVGSRLIWDQSAGAFGNIGQITVATGDITGGAIVAAPAASGDTTGVVKLTPGNTTLTP
jgi:predicted RecA/RadA family phage recombinase